ncbi:retrotransposon protein [Cucumis melo var. makuwa]|uniref:Retrotransposon protein n=1 Tax=Cucumis melo var. makuwa TaxID=1194695 RepID=A0A5A7TVW2_CUCMM|nr:retrotransposon protein [Cucumis melo var. makuwa]TYK08357.1 retrotransposon protein [Cucumis melo var. makuwa]
MSASTRASRYVWTEEEEAKGLLNKPFLYYDELTYVFGRDRVTGRFAETFADVESNDPGGYEGFDIANGNEEFPHVYS